MAKSKNKRKNGSVKKYLQKDLSGKIISKHDKSLLREIKTKQMMRTQLLHQACESLNANEVQTQIDKGKNSEMSYISTKLDENGVPCDGETKSISLSSADIERLKSIHRYKVRIEKQSKVNIIQ